MTNHFLIKDVKGKLCTLPNLKDRDGSSMSNYQKIKNCCDIVCPYLKLKDEL